MYVARVLVASFLLTFVLGFGYGKFAGVPWDQSELAATLDGAITSTTSTPPSSTSNAPAALASSGTAAAPTTVPPAPAGGRRPTPADPLRIVMAGDSVMAGLSPAVEYALDKGGAADVRFVLTPSILRDPTIRFTWEQQLEQFDPEVIVMFVGTWESRQVETTAGQKLSIGAPGWRESYETEVLDPWVRFISARGAKVIWIGAPVTGNDEANLLFSTLNQVFSDLPTRFPNVTYLDSSGALQGSIPGFHPIIPGDDGRPIRTRQVDGLHLCPDGAALLAKPLLQWFADEWQVPLAFGWQSQDWRNDARVYPKVSCPAA